MKRKKVKLLSRVQLFATPWTIAYQTPQSMEIFQARVLEWVAISFSRGSSWPTDRTRVSCIEADTLLPEPPGKPYNWLYLSTKEKSFFKRYLFGQWPEQQMCLCGFFKFFSAIFSHIWYIYLKPNLSRKMPRQFKREKLSFQQMALEKWIPNAKEWSWTPTSYHIQKLTQNRTKCNS